MSPSGQVGGNGRTPGVSLDQTLFYAEELRQVVAREETLRSELHQAQAREEKLAKELGAASSELTSVRTQMTEYARDLKAAFDLERNRDDELRGSYAATIHVLAAAVEARDPYTGGHIERVMHYSLVLARSLGWNRDQLQQVEMGAALHDVGKLSVQDAVLRKPGALDEHDWNQMRSHPEMGARIVSHVQHLESVVPYVLFHHEHYDGSGYPFGLSGEAIPIEGRLVAVADAFDAMTTARPYRRAMMPDQALERIVADAGKHFDPRMVHAFARSRDELHAVRTQGAA